jgi:hypothetical protein
MGNFAKSVTIATALLFAASPAQAQLTDERVEEIFIMAKDVCPAAMAADDAGAYVSQVMDEKELEGSETLLLLNFCIIYAEGAISGAGGAAE